MAIIRDYASSVYDDGPTANPTEPDKAQIRALFGIIDQEVENARALATSGAQWKEPVRAASGANVAISTALENGDSLDGVTLATGDRVLLYGQSAPAQNGIYVVPASGAASRASDANEADELRSLAVFVQAGTVNGGKQFICTEAGTITVGTTALPFVELSDQSALNANLADKLDKGETEAQLLTVPIVRDDDGQVAVSLLNGDLHARGVSPALRRKAVADIVRRSPEGARTALMTAGHRVVLWLQGGVLRGPGLNDGAGNGAVPLATDGRSLYRVRQQIARIKAGVSGAKVRIALAGDSWSEMATIATAMRNLLDASMDITGEGWQSVKGDFLMSGVTFSKSAGWTVLDASTNSDWPYGVGADGHNIHTNGASETVTIGNLPATTIRIYSHQHGGTWRYRVDGGSWTTVTEGSDASLRITTISGLSDTAHTLEIDTTGNTGIVSIGGFYSTRSVAGAEVLKIGNGGLTGYRLRDFAPLIGDQLADMQPDLLIVNLGTNDYRNGYSTVQTYVDGLAAMVTAAQAAIADIGIIFVVPAQTDGTVVTPLSLYRDAAYSVAKSRGCELLNMLDQFGSYAESNARGQWADGFHLNTAGAGCLATIINNSFIGL